MHYTIYMTHETPGDFIYNRMCNHAASLLILAIKCHMDDSNVD